MTRTAISDLSAEQLVDRFTSIALAQDEAINNDENSKYNRLFGEMHNLKEELKRRDQRRLLLPLLLHGNAQVRLKSAIALLAVDREASLNALQTISDRNEYPQAADARGMIEAVAEGRYLPT
jgi:Domain of unknown function (DUF2019)